MQLPSWTRRLLWRQRSRRARRERRQEARLGLRRLEDRRVLDVSAAFLTGTGVLELDLTTGPDTATVGIENGDLVIHDRSDQSVAIDVDGGGAGRVRASQVSRIEVRGDAAADQQFVLAQPLSLEGGLWIDDQVELTDLRGDVQRTTDGDVRIESGRIRLAAAIDAPGREIRLAGNVSLADDVTLIGRDVLFEGTIDDDGNAGTSSRLTVEAAGLTRFAADVGGANPLDRLSTDTPGRVELNGDLAARGGSVIFNDPVLLTSDVSIVDSGPTGIHFHNRLDSQTGARHTLMLSAPNASISFSGDIGNGGSGDQSLGGLTISSAAQGVVFGNKAGVGAIATTGSIDIGVGVTAIGGVGIVFNGSGGATTLLSHGGDVRLNGPWVLASDVTVLTGGGDLLVTADAPTDSQSSTSHRLTIDVGAGAAAFHEDLGGITALSGLTITRADGGVTFGGASTETADGTGPVDRIRSTGPIVIGAGAATGGIIVNAGVGQTVLVTTTNDPVTINGPLTLRSDLSIDTGSRGGDIVFTTAARVVSDANQHYDLTLNAGEGRVAVGATVGYDPAQPAADLALGRLQVVRADAGVAVTADRVFAHDGVDVGVGTSAIAGGIRLDGGGAELLLRTVGGAVRLNGPTTLHSAVGFETGLLGGDVVFTNDAPVDSVAGGEHALRFDVGNGAVRFNEDLGATNRLGSLTVTTARGGVYFGEAATETPGSGTTGPVSLIRTGGPIDVGVGGNAVGGITFFGGAAPAVVIETTADNVRFNGAVTLATNLSINTGGTGPSAGDVVFTNDAPVDSLAGRSSNLVVNAGAARVLFNEDVGATNALGRLTVTRADGGIVLGGADVETPGSGGNGPVNLVRTNFEIDLGAAANVVAGGIWLNGGTSPLELRTNGFEIRLNGPTRLQGDTRLDTGDAGGAVVLTSSTTVDSHDGPGQASVAERNNLTMHGGTGNVSINADVGAIQRLGAVTIERAGSVALGGADTGVIGGLGPVTRMLTDGPINVGSAAAIAGGITLNAGPAALQIATSADDVRFAGPTELASDATIDTGPGGGNLLFTGAAPINSQSSEANDLRIALGTGNATFTAALGANRPLGELHIVSATDVVWLDAVHAANLVQESGAGETRFAAAVNVSHATLPGLVLVGNGFTLDGPVRAAGDGRISIQHAGVLDLNTNADFRADGSFSESGSGVTELAANIVTSGDAIAFGTPVTLTDGAAAAVLLDTTAGGQAAGADVSFARAVDAASAGQESLTINAGTGGDVAWTAAVGGGTRLGELRIVSAADVTAAGSITASNVVQELGTGTTLLSGPLNTNSVTAAGLALTTVNVTLVDAVTTTGDGRVLIDVSGLLDLGPLANMSLAGEFRQGGAGAAAISADITTSGDDVTYTGAVTIRDDLRFDTGGGAGNVRFGDRVNGVTDCQEDLTLAAGTGSIQFADAVGDLVGVGDVRIENAAVTTFVGSVRANSLRQDAGSGETAFDGAVTVKSAGGMVLVSESITFHGPLDTSLAHGPVTLRAANDIFLGGLVASGRGEVMVAAGDDVRLGPAGAITTVDAAVNITADADAMADAGAGGALLMADGAVINAGNAPIRLAADERVQLGRLVTTTLVTVTSHSGAITDGGDSGGLDIVADRAALRAEDGIGVGNPIDTSLNRLAATNELGGGIRLNNRVGGLLTIGEVDGLSGLTTGPALAPTKLGGNIEISNVNHLTVDAPVLNNAGGHLILRAEVDGDLTLNRPVQNHGGHGWIFLFAGGDLIVHDSVPEYTHDGTVTGTPRRQQDGGLPVPSAEISTENEGAIRGEAGGDVLFDDDSDLGYVIVRTHSERYPDAANLPVLSEKFRDPAAYPKLADDLAFYNELVTELDQIRNSVSAQITNVAPILDILPVDIGGSTIDSRGRAILKVFVGNELHLERNFHIVVDWGDGTIENYTVPGSPAASRGFIASSGARINLLPDATITGRFDSGELVGDERALGIYFFHHTYAENPDPDDAALPVPVRVELRYDARGEGETNLDDTRPSDGSGIFNGIRFIRNLTEEIFAVAEDNFKNPGAGQTTFIKVFESVIVPVAAREVTTIAAANTTAVSTFTTTRQIEFRVQRQDIEVQEEFRLYLKVVNDVTGEESEDTYPLSFDFLQDPVSLFRTRRFPNGHYRVYLEEIRTRRIRLILDIHVYEGKVVPPNFQEGAAERLPGLDQGAAVTTDHPDRVAADAAATPSTPRDAETTRPAAGTAADGLFTTQPDASAATADSVPLPSAAGTALAMGLLPWRAALRRALAEHRDGPARLALRRRLRQARG